MNLDLSKPGVVEVRLSRRNLLALLTKLDMDGSARTLELPGEGYVVPLLRVIAEDDGPHYAALQRQPGVLHPQTESDIR